MVLGPGAFVEDFGDFEEVSIMLGCVFESFFCAERLLRQVISEDVIYRQAMCEGLDVFGIKLL